MSSRTPCLWLAVSITLLALAAQGLAGVRLVRVGTFDEPVFVTAPPGDTRRVFVVERTGTVRIVVDGHAIPRPFVDLRSRVSQPTSPSDERVSKSTTRIARCATDMWMLVFSPS